jgi:hypothetical protein
MSNLDYICIKHGQSISYKGDENILRKALGILKEDGVYAMFLWLESKDKDKDKKIRDEIIKMLNEDKIKNYLLGYSGETPNSFSNDFEGFCKNLRTISQDKDINKLFFLKKVLERTLTYALYHVKVKEDEKNVSMP